MSNYRIKIIAVLCVTASLAGVGTARANKEHSKSHSQAHSYNQSAAMPSQNNESGSQVRMAAMEGQEKKFSELQGKQLSAKGGEELGKIEDVVIDTQSGKIAYLAVSAGDNGAGGDKLRLVPQSSLQCEDNAQGLTSQMDKAAFDALATVDRSELQAGRMPDSAQHSTSFGSSAASSATAPDSTPSASSTGATTVGQDQPGSFANSNAGSQMSNHLVCASKLSGKQVRANGEDVGTIETVAVDLEQGNATAVLKASNSFAGSDATFYVPFMKLQIDSADASTINTTLARSDFTDASSSQSSSSSTTASTASQDTSLPPTGRTDDQSNSGFSSSSATPSTSSSPYSTATGSSSAPTSTGDVTATAPTTSTTTPSPDDASNSSTGQSSSTYSSATSGSTSVTGTTPGSTPESAAAGTSPSSTDTFGSAGTPSSTTPSSTTPSTSSTITGFGTDANSSSTTSSAGSTSSTGSTSPDTFGSSSSSTTTPPTSNYGTSGTSTSGTTSDVATSGTSPSTSGTSSTSTLPGTSSATSTSDDDSLSATGRDSGNPHASMSATAAAIRTAIGNDPTLASENIRVQEAGRKIMLHGKVSNEETKNRIEQIAKSAASGTEVENKLKVENQK